MVYTTTIRGLIMAIKSYQKFWMYLAKLFHLETFIETGTGYGETCSEIYEGFKDVYSIELEDFLHRLAIERFKDAPNIHLKMGDSAIAIRALLQEIPTTPTLFFLDAHGPEDPLPQEVKAILQLRPPDQTLIVIDDQTDNKLSNVKANGVNLKDWVIIYDDVRMVMMYHKDSKFYWPEFEG